MPCICVKALALPAPPKVQKNATSGNRPFVAIK
jgi:hypothetical protein